MDTDNRTRMGLVSRPEPRSTHLTSERPWENASEALRPADKFAFAETLTPCLALVGGAAWRQEDRKEWLRAAAGTLEGIPVDLLRRGAKHAQMLADHPSKIVPLILDCVRQSWDNRKRNFASRSEPPAERIEAQYVTPAQAASILKEYGIDQLGKRDVTAPGKRESEVPRHVGEKPRMPTAEELAILAAEARADHPEMLIPAPRPEPGYYPDLDDDFSELDASVPA
jgi:hypothetical protein